MYSVYSVPKCAAPRVPSLAAPRSSDRPARAKTGEESGQHAGTRLPGDIVHGQSRIWITGKREVVGEWVTPDWLQCYQCELPCVEGPGAKVDCPDNCGLFREYSDIA